MYSYIIPSHNRPSVLAETVQALEALHASPDAPRAELVIVDNASSPPIPADAGVPGAGRAKLAIRILRSEENLGAAARNLGVDHASAASRWIIMLDDDSAPLNLGFIDAIREADADPNSDIAVIAAEIFLPSQGPDQAQVVRESGGLPEVFIGCGAAIRRESFLAAGGYDPSFGYYAEEYDLAARLIAAGQRITFDRRFAVLHRKVTAGRDMNRIIGRLIRNNIRIAQRYAPADELWPTIAEHTIRYAKIAWKESAVRGYLGGVLGAAIGWFSQHHAPLPPHLWARFTGLAAAREAMAHHRRQGITRARLIATGKNVAQIRRAMADCGITEVSAQAARADTPDTPRLIGTLSPGPLLDASDAHLAQAARQSPSHPQALHHRVLLPWLVPESAAQTSQDPQIPIGASPDSALGLNRAAVPSESIGDRSRSGGSIRTQPKAA